jgi:hypothetical protein
LALVGALPVQHPARQHVDTAGDVVLDLADRFLKWVKLA